MRFTYLLCAFLLLVPGITQSQVVYNPANGHYYERVDEVVEGWFNAVSVAASRTYQGLRGHLVTITSSEENDFIVNNLGGDLVRHKWTGAYQFHKNNEPNGAWAWITGEAWSYTNWRAGEPNNASNVEDTVSISGDYPQLTWNDVSFYAYAGYLVEYEADTTPIVYNPANGHYYERVDIGVDGWFNAVTAAAWRTYQGLRGHLVTITSQEENDFIVNSLGGDLIREKWTGAYQINHNNEPAGSWVWITGEAWSYTNWQAEEPNNLGNVEHTMSFKGLGYPLGSWNDVSFSGFAGYLVEYEGTSISGHITLPEAVNQAQLITFEFRPVEGGSDIIRSLTLNTDGSYELDNIPYGNYRVWIKGPKWLATVIAADTTSGGIIGVDATLVGGDANNDNSVDVLDLDALIQAFDSDPNAQNWNVNADFNCDESVDVLDLDLLIRNFDLSGDA